MTTVAVNRFVDDGDGLILEWPSRRRRRSRAHQTSVTSLSDWVEAHQLGRHDQLSHGRWARGRSRPGMGDIPIDEKWRRDFSGGSAEAHLVQRDDGGWEFTPERQALHDDIIRRRVGDKASVDNPRYGVLGGGPASGKSHYLRSEAGVDWRDDEDTLVVNSDDMKAELPEYRQRLAAGDRTAAPFTHEESSYLAARMQAAGFERRTNVTLDGTGDSAPQKLRTKIDAARQAGYEVHGRYVTVDTDTAWNRAVDRAERTGRFVPESYLRQRHADVSATVAQTYADFDSFELYDTSANTLDHVVSARGEQLTVHNDERWRAFLAKGRQ